MVNGKDLNSSLFALGLVVLATEFFNSLDFVRWVIEAGVLISLLFLFKKNTGVSEKPSESEEKDRSDVESSKVSASVIELSETLGYEAVIIDQEIDRVDGLVKDAVQLMAASFHNVQELSEKQKSLAHGVMMQETPADNSLTTSDCDVNAEVTEMGAVEEQVSSLSLVSAEIRTAIDGAVRGLQFEDMASQAVRSIHDNVNTIRQVAELVPKLILPNGTIDDVIAAKLHGLCLELREATKARNDARTVSQSDLDEGDVELF